jgi:hypothetical protein
MVTAQTADVARRAKQLYEESLKAHLEATHQHDFVAIEPESGNYYLGKTLSEAIQASRVAHPDRLAFAIRVGDDTAVHLGVLTP